MLELDAHNVAQFLVATGRLPAPVPARVLSGGVSNIVLWVDAAPRPFVLKQSRPRLRTRDPWFSNVERIFREVDAMRALRAVLGPVVPEILFEDRANYLFAMSAAPADAVVWKQELLAGHADLVIARRAGELLAAMHRRGAVDADWRERFADQENFYQLRLEPFYLRLRSRAADLAAALDQLVADTNATRLTLVHADFSPKNMLIKDHAITLVDYETVHFGDPAFDLGFLLAHLSLKAIHHADACEPFLALIAEFWKAYLPSVTFESREALTARALRHLAGIALVRIDGTSPVDYLTEEGKRAAGRAFARALLASNIDDWQTPLELLEDEIARLRPLH